MQKYELMLVLPGTLDEKEAEVKSTEVLNMVKQGDKEATIIALGKNRLAYPVKQIRYGYFYTIHFSMESDTLKVLQDKIALMRDILRGIVYKHNPKWADTQKISYVTNNMGVTTMKEPEVSVPKAAEETTAAAAPAKAEEKKLDMKEIDKKLDEILGGSIITGV